MTRWMLLSDFLAEQQAELGRRERREREPKRRRDREEREERRPGHSAQTRPPSRGPQGRGPQGRGPQAPQRHFLRPGGPQGPFPRAHTAPVPPSPPPEPEEEPLDGYEDDEAAWYDEEPEPSEGSEGDFAGLGWGPAAELSPNVRVQARPGFRAVLMPLRPGLAVVAEVPEGFTQGFGAVGVLGSLVLLATQKALRRSTERPEDPGLLERMLARRAPEPAAPTVAGAPDWASDEDLGQVFGCAPDAWRGRR